MTREYGRLTFGAIANAESLTALAAAAVSKGPVTLMPRNGAIKATGLILTTAAVTYAAAKIRHAQHALARKTIVTRLTPNTAKTLFGSLEALTVLIMTAAGKTITVSSQVNAALAYQALVT